MSIVLCLQSEKILIVTVLYRLDCLEIIVSKCEDLMCKGLVCMAGLEDSEAIRETLNAVEIVQVE